MNRMDRPEHGGQAGLRYQDGDFQVMTPGAFVVCAVTGEEIPLEELKYWSVERQEAYVDATAAVVRYKDFGSM